MTFIHIASDDALRNCTIGGRKADERHSALAALAQQIASTGIPAEAVEIYKGRNIVVRYDTPLGAVNIKQFKVPHIINRLVYGNLRHGKARHSFENAEKLIAKGFHTPQPLAYIEHRQGVLFGISYFVSEQLEGYAEIRDLATLEHREAIVEAVGQLMADLHRAHIFMKDFSQGNVLWRREADGSIRLALVDINRMDFDVSSTRRLMKNFRNVADDPDLLNDLALAYSRASGMPSDEALRRANRARSLFLRKRHIKKLLK